MAPNNASLTIPQVNIPIFFRDLTSANFTPALEQQLIDSIQMTVSKVANVNISLVNITSVQPINMVVSTTFLDGNQASAAVLLGNAQQAAVVRMPLSLHLSLHAA